MTFRIAVVAEDSSGASLVKGLCDRVLLRQPWIAGFESDGDIDHLAAFRVFLPDPSNRGHFHPKDARSERASDAASFRKTFTWLAKNHQPEAVLVARDSDQDASRRRGIQQAIHEHRQDFGVALALMVPESEAWRIALVDREARAAEIATLRKELGFDPVAEPHELSSAPTSKKEAKTVAARLYGNEPPPIDDRALDVLSRHEVAGAASYLRDLQTAVVAPIVGGRAS
jgi:hypothetical protein